MLRRSHLFVLVVACAFAVSGRATAGDEPGTAAPAAPPAAPSAPAAKRPAEIEFVQVSKSCRVAVRADGESNAAIVAGSEAVAIVDCLGSPARAEALLAEVKRITDKPVRHVVLTHWHYDHSVGDHVFGKDVEILASAGSAAELSTRLEQARVLLDPRTGMHGSVGIADVRDVTRQVKGATDLDLGGVTLRLTEAGACHSAGDLVAWIPAEQVLLAGDLVSNGHHPNVSAGSSFRWIEALARLEKLKPERVVPGHGAVGAGELLATQRTYLMTVRRVVKHLARGKVPVEEIVKGLGIPDEFSALGHPAFWPANVRFVHDELMGNR